MFERDMVAPLHNPPRHSEVGICPGCAKTFTRQEVARQMWPDMPKGRPVPWVHRDCWECEDHHPLPIMARVVDGVVLAR